LRMRPASDAEIIEPGRGDDLSTSPLDMAG
jgi:hypothetical protein